MSSFFGFDRNLLLNNIGEVVFSSCKRILGRFNNLRNANA